MLRALMCDAPLSAMLAIVTAASAMDNKINAVLWNNALLGKVVRFADGRTMAVFALDRSVWPEGQDEQCMPAIPDGWESIDVACPRATIEVPAVTAVLFQSHILERMRQLSGIKCMFLGWEQLYSADGIGRVLLPARYVMFNADVSVAQVSVKALGL